MKFQFYTLVFIIVYIIFQETSATDLQAGWQNWASHYIVRTTRPFLQKLPLSVCPLCPVPISTTPAPCLLTEMNTRSKPLYSGSGSTTATPGTPQTAASCSLSILGSTQASRCNLLQLNPENRSYFMSTVVEVGIFCRLRFAALSLCITLCFYHKLHIPR